MCQPRVPAGSHPGGKVAKSHHIKYRLARPLVRYEGAAPHARRGWCPHSVLHACGMRPNARKHVGTVLPWHVQRPRTPFAVVWSTLENFENFRKFRQQGAPHEPPTGAPRQHSEPPNSSLLRRPTAQKTPKQRFSGTFYALGSQFKSFGALLENSKKCPDIL